jgi:cytochrome c peroxidase
LISHQILSRIARSDVDDIHWGSLMQNVVSRIPIGALGRPPADFRKSVHHIQLGDTGRGFADPTGIVALPDGFAVLSGGARQLSIYKNREPAHRVDVGRRPTRLSWLSDDLLAVANEHDGTISLVSMTGEVQPKTIELSTEGSSPVSAGEAAFYDASLSHDSWMTCNSCHVDAHTPGLPADTFGDGSFGDAKLIPSLFGAKTTRPYGWLGNKPELSSQITTTFASTMHAKNPPPEVAAHLVDFLEGLATPPTTDDADKDDADKDIEPGRQVFKSLKCNECHRPPTFTSATVRDVGLKDAVGNHAFNPPSLRGLRFRRAYFHDARAKSLQAVFKEYHHQLNGGLPEEDLRQLLIYLNSL